MHVYQQGNHICLTCELTFHSVNFNNWWNCFWFGCKTPFWEALMHTRMGGSHPRNFLDTITILLHIGQILTWNCHFNQPNQFSIELRCILMPVQSSGTLKLHWDPHSWAIWAKGQMKNHLKNGHFPTWFFTLLFQTVITPKPIFLLSLSCACRSFQEL